MTIETPEVRPSNRELLDAGPLMLPRVILSCGIPLPDLRKIVADD